MCDVRNCKYCKISLQDVGGGLRIFAQSNELRQDEEGPSIIN